MKTHLLVQDGESKTLLAEVDLEVVPRGIYMVDGTPYQYTGQPTFIINTFKREGGIRYTGKLPSHTLERVELTVEKMP
jgi:hypothetical protein